MCFLTHGERGILYSADSLPIELDKIKSYFNGDNCPYLFEKPKLFFLQACQGQENQSIYDQHFSIELFKQFFCFLNHYIILLIHNLFIKFLLFALIIC